MVGLDQQRFLRDSIPKDALCQKCTNVMVNPVSCKKCKLWACQSCSQNEVSQTDCIHEFSDVNKFLKDKIDQMIIKCRYYQYGCQKTMKVSLIENHENQCQFERIICQNQDCMVELSKKNFQDHVNTCGYVLIICDGGCNKQMKLMEKQSHNCIEYLQSVIENLNKNNKHLQEENNQIKQLNNNLLLDLSTKQNCSDISMLQKDDQIEKLNQKVTKLQKDLEIQKQNQENSIQNAVQQFQEQVENRLKIYWTKSDHEFDNLSKRLGEQVNSYVQNLNKNLQDFNMRVQADSSELVSLPKDLKDIDKSPLKITPGKSSSKILERSFTQNPRSLNLNKSFQIQNSNNSK